MTLVAELDFGPDETVAGHGPGAETEFVADYPTGMQMEAWSLVDDEPEAVGSWRPALALFSAAVVAFGVVVAGWFITNRHEDLSVPAVVGVPSVSLDPADPPTAAVEPPQIPPDVDHQLSGDTWYLSMVNAGLSPIEMSVSNPLGEVSDGHRVCGYIAQGHTVDQTINEVVVGLPDNLPPDKAHTIAQAVVDAAVRAYCPVNTHE